MRAGILGLVVMATLALASPATRRHDDDEPMEMDMSHGHSDSPVDTLDSVPVPATSSSHMHSHDSESDPSSSTSNSSITPQQPPDPHSHHSHAPAKTVLDDDDIHNWHDFPPTYLAADFRLDKDSTIFGEVFPEDWDKDTVPSHPGLMIVHVGSMIAAYFVILPIALALRAAGHPSHYLVNAVFLGVAILGWLAGVTYKAAMPDMYEHSKHGGMGNLLLLLSISLATLDSLGLIKRTVAFYRAGNRDWRSFFSEALADVQIGKTGTYEMVGLRDGENTVFALGDDDDEDDEHSHDHGVDPLDTRGQPSQPRVVAPHPVRPGMSRHYSPTASSRHSTGSEGTLQESPTNTHAFKQSGSGEYDEDEVPVWNTPKVSGWKQVVEVALVCTRRAQVVFAYVMILTGFPIYVGMCRGGYVNSCAAHFIKGSIFFGYGVLTFSRYLGAFADFGWAWNRRPTGSRAVSAEMVECFVIFLYGASNTWMERFGSAPGDPYTVKQVQHISIAVMFWFAGLAGMLLESPTVRRMLGAVLYTKARARDPPSYMFSFNPLPALTIAVTGLAMAAHHQEYLFEVDIHWLWGVLLAGGSACRFLTYFFLFLRPPTESMLPSRPPTEVLTSFGWAAGGIVFMLSDEEFSFAAMRSGFDDMMAFLNVTVALTCLVFCWVVVVLAIKGMAVLRIAKRSDIEQH